MSKFMDPLGDTEGSSSDSGSESDGDEAVPRVGSAAAGRQHQTGVAPLDVDPEALVSGNSVLFVPEPKKDPNDQWDWGNGADHKEAGGDEETAEVREENRHAVGAGLEASVALANKAAMQAAELREAKRREHAEKQAERRKSYQQKEKRKRDLGMQKSDKDYVQEEKRIARTHGV
eukprot:CAMPEP_0206150162 /NCGR_PEP_ID=MMETSP1473-20131121/38157_1 /ASSEMBLY_ACC=CAM_ASM_001109 /TAXON_ID=1461547 /ORGANISM="Stichococcus sp, Strain RCC1054" /LENGTH=174 /DNA_ID=CAMNT_0053547655 /DNA_START=254 /DNA_END=778 /DNA_ORIENTATION=-